MPPSAMRRGVSICSQDAISFANLLKSKYNIDYNVIGLGGHVLMQAKINNQYLLSDPNTGLTFPFSIEEYYDSKENQLKVKNTYKNIDRSDLALHFDKKANKILSYTGPEVRDNTFNPDSLTFYSNFLKWILPIVLFIATLSFKIRSKFLIIKNYFKF